MMTLTLDDIFKARDELKNAMTADPVFFNKKEEAYYMLFRIFLSDRKRKEYQKIIDSM